MRDQELGKKGGKIRKQCRLCGTYSVYAVNILHCFIKLRNIESNNAFESNSVPLVQLINDCLDINVSFGIRLLFLLLLLFFCTVF